MAGTSQKTESGTIVLQTEHWAHRSELYTGWLKDGADGYWYYLDPNTGEMLTGWREIKGQWYYLNPETLGDSGWMQDSSTKQWNYNVKAVMPKGALYVNTQTPDGYFVDENGVRR